jgi:hypothetical protein
MEQLTGTPLQILMFLGSLIGIIVKSRNELKNMYNSIILEYTSLLETLKESENKCKEELDLVKSDIVKLKVKLAKLEGN